MVKIEEAKDWYGLSLKVGDNVIPMCSEVAVMDIKGEIKSISQGNGCQWLDIYNSEEDRLYKGFNANNFSTQQRLDELD